jgi:DNA-binding NtrC family response regulator
MSTPVTRRGRFSWPGSVRELQNFIERSVILSNGSGLSGSLLELTHTRLERLKKPDFSATETLEEAARAHILRTLEQTGGVIGGLNGAAVKLGLPRTTLKAKMKRLGIGLS